MGSESQPADYSDQLAKHMKAVEYFDRELDSLMYPTTREQLMNATSRLIVGLFGYDWIEAGTRTNVFDERHDIPGEDELEEYPNSLPEMLKLGIFDQLPEEYIIAYGPDEFDKWIKPFLQSVLKGHIEESQTAEHVMECPERFCPAPIIACYVDDRLRGQVASAEKNPEYAVYEEEMIHMNTKIVEVLTEFDIFDPVGAKNLLADYHRWLERIEDYPLKFNES